MESRRLSLSGPATTALNAETVQCKPVSSQQFTIDDTSTSSTTTTSTTSTTTTTTDDVGVEKVTLISRVIEPEKMHLQRESTKETEATGDICVDLDVRKLSIGSSFTFTEDKLLELAIPPSTSTNFNTTTSTEKKTSPTLQDNPQQQPQQHEENIASLDNGGGDDENVFMTCLETLVKPSSSSTSSFNDTFKPKIQTYNNYHEHQIQSESNALLFSSLESPHGIISEDEIKQTLSYVGDINDNGMGPGRIRKYASQDPDSEEWKTHSKHFFILSYAGKPIYSRYGNEDKLSSLMGVIQAIISVYQDLDDSIRCIHADEYSFVFLVRGPLFFVIVSNGEDTELALREELLWLYNQIVSIITSSQLSRIFNTHRNFDLRRLLGGTESFLDHLCETVGHLPGYILGAIHSIKMEPSIRNSVGSALQNAKNYSKFGLLYGMLIVKDSLVTLLRPKKHSFHPSDLHLILNMVNSSSSFKSVPESWMPICLPKFNDKGFLHAYIAYITPNYPPPAHDLCLVLICNDRDNFFQMSECKRMIVQHLTTSGSLFLLQDSIRNSNYSLKEVSIPGLRHFLFKSKGNIQFTMPVLEPPYDDPKEEKKLFQLYSHVRSKLYTKNRPLKLLHYVTKFESVFAWNTTSFELYANFSPLVTKQNVIYSVNSLLRWIKKEEEFLFVTKAPTF